MCVSAFMFKRHVSVMHLLLTITICKSIFIIHVHVTDQFFINWHSHYTTNHMHVQWLCTLQFKIATPHDG